jgi:bacterioferritin
MDITGQLEIHAKQDLNQSWIISRQIDYREKMPLVPPPEPVRTSKGAKKCRGSISRMRTKPFVIIAITLRKSRRIAIAEQILQILVQEQDHQIDLASALGEAILDISGPEGRALRKAPLAAGLDQYYRPIALPLRGCLNGSRVNAIDLIPHETRRTQEESHGATDGEAPFSTAAERNTPSTGRPGRFQSNSVRRCRLEGFRRIPSRGAPWRRCGQAL